VEEQTEQVLKNLAAVLEAGGSDPAHVLRVTVYVSDISLWDRVNRVYGEFFGEHKPARTVVPTRDLHHGFLVEIDAIAAVVSKEETPCIPDQE
ncbi:MAG: RidA family protein, partial [Synergistaceae bacterium]|nr:RidA family protein [Synergistaceae bacterium]